MSIDYANIIKGCRRHDRRAQNALYDALAPMAMGVCMRYAHDRDEAQDMLQDAMVIVFEKIGEVKDATKVGAWAYRVVVNECLRHCRSRRLEYEPTGGLEENVGQLPLDPFSTEEVVMALQQLTVAQRLVFNLVEVEGYTYAEVAKRLKSSEVNVRVLLSRAKSRLRMMLDPTTPTHHPLPGEGTNFASAFPSLGRGWGGE